MLSLCSFIMTIRIRVGLNSIRERMSKSTILEFLLGHVHMSKYGFEGVYSSSAS